MTMPSLRLLLLSIAWMPLMAQAGVQLQIKGLDERLQGAVRSGVELSQYSKGQPTEAQVRRLYQRSFAQARAALEPYGYFNAEINGDLKQAGNDWLAVLTIEPGEPVRVTSRDISLDDAASKLPEVQRALRAFVPRKGQALDQGLYDQSRDTISAALTAVGYLDARLTVRRVEVYRADHRADIKLAWDVGRRYRFGAVHFSGSQFKDGFLPRYLPFKPGDYFSQTDLLRLQQALTGADYFSVVNVLPQVDTASEGNVDVKVELVPAKRTVYTGGPFVGTDTGVGIRMGMERRWINRSGHTWANELVYAQHLKTLSTLYSIPMPGDNQRSFNFGANFRDSDTRSSQSRTLELVGNETRQWHGWTRTLGVHALSGTFTVGRIGDEPLDTPGIERGRSTLVFAEAALLRKQADNYAFVRHGWSIALSGRSTAGALLSDTRYTQLLADAKWIHALGRRDRLILRGTAGMSMTGDFSSLPPQLRFFAGGDRSVRGYGYQAIGPRNSYDRVVGGRNLLVMSTELEHYFSRDWGMAAFVDTGNAYNGTDYRPKVGAGLGLRWRSPVGLIRIDLGVPVHDSHAHGVQLHLLIGPDL